MGPNGLYFAALDNLYVASFAGGEILVTNPRSGKTVNHLGAAAGVVTPDDLIFGPESEEGRLFVALDFLGAGLYELDPDLTAPSPPDYRRQREQPGT